MQQQKDNLLQAKNSNTTLVKVKLAALAYIKEQYVFKYNSC